MSSHGSPIRTVFDEDGIQVHTSNADSHVQWTAFSKYVQMDDVYLLIRKRDPAIIVPKRAFSTTSLDAMRFHELVDQQIGVEIQAKPR